MSDEATAEAQAPTAGRGRPRPESTIAHDAEVLEYLQSAGEPQTRKQIVEGTGKAGNKVYLSLYRLSRTNQIHRNGSAWVVGAAPEAAEAPPAE